MGDAGPLLERYLRRPDVEAAVHLARVGGHDLAAESLSDAQRERALSDGRWTEDGYDARRAVSNVRNATRAMPSVAASGTDSP